MYMYNAPIDTKFIWNNLSIISNCIWYYVSQQQKTCVYVNHLRHLCNAPLSPRYNILCTFSIYWNPFPILHGEYKVHWQTYYENNERISKLTRKTAYVVDNLIYIIMLFLQLLILIYFRYYQILPLQVIRTVV